ncbi:hypothetical protein Z517_08238 [Fonsecaea pedrosoi CBS 271.37]|uniref:Zn(2)-C6 fungal-type domain-containing protein n=1 Tax=Fonsecaea pedrosoi CBS 271.37 TaxID=1442368 RepID=A0A0D2EVY5_9EURO|nr:uncharacterized protein Z517_08238 [Fonsecaea pedrosoi CBS 271.37]KIW78402.1 hypothetical protein Z517_08238 [Fonsecaea pedrosoi CBS 271.37]
MSPASKINGACIICRKRKVKCDLTQVGQPCTNCRSGEYDCLPHRRKRRRYTVTDSPDDSANVTQQGQVADHNESMAPPRSSLPVVTGSEQIAIVVDDSDQRTSPVFGDSSTTEYSYVGRCEYLGGQIHFTEDLTRRPSRSRPDVSPHDSDLHFLQIQHALDLPPRPVRAALVSAFMERCHPWTPIVELSWVNEPNHRHDSLLLEQSVFLAGSRVLNSPLTYASSQEYYARARTLFFHGHPRNTLLSIVATCLLQWWNPTGPETISTDTSSFWTRIGIELAHQMGLHLEPKDQPHKGFRRRLWWTLVTRDNIVSVGVGRPRTINLDDSTVKAPSINDFPVVDTNAHLFVAYVSICRQMGDLAEAHRRRLLTDARRRSFENSLFCWIHQLPPSLKVSYEQPSKVLSAYSLEKFQLHICYFVSLLILYKGTRVNTPESTAALMAASFIAGMLEEIMARDEIRYLGPIFPFYALAAGLTGLTGYRYTDLRTKTEDDFAVIKAVLEHLGHRWQSANGVSCALLRVREMVQGQSTLDYAPVPLTPSLCRFFEAFSPDLCRFWHFQSPRPTVSSSDPNRDSQDSARLSHIILPREEPVVTQTQTLISDQVDLQRSTHDEDLPLFNDAALGTDAAWLFDDAFFTENSVLG